MTDLTPRHALPDPAGEAVTGATANEQAGGRATQTVKRRRVTVGVVVAVLVLAAAFIAIQGLRNATLFFRNVDEAIAQADELGDRRFRLQGRVVLGTVATSGGVTTFEVTHNCAVASVQHTTDPPELFASPWIPVVLEGAWRRSASAQSTSAQRADDLYFLSDRMLVKHTNEYEAANAERLAESAEPDPLEGCDTDT